MSDDDDDDEGEYTDPIPSLRLTTSPNSYMRIEVRLSFVVETKLPQETTEPSFGTNISQLIFSPSPSPKKATINDQPNF